MQPHSQQISDTNLNDPLDAHRLSQGGVRGSNPSPDNRAADIIAVR